ncbi:MAG: hypothetical protein HYW86_02830 [Candidatus Roizmanbacteria bacterium]|nr:MAG: hypothetical protein HYW86_02830 [Candidatus Roizmanbacteria bacterium]
MKERAEIGIGLLNTERKRMSAFLRKFIPHVKPNKLVACGGLATRYHLQTHGITFPQRPFNDLDLLIKAADDILPSITSDFMLYHYHPAGVDDPIEKTYFFYAFIDPETKIKADVFPYRWSSPKRFIQATFKGKLLPIVGAEDQLIQCLYDVSRISETMKVDPKQLQDVHSLLQITDTSLAEQIWRSNSHPLYPKTLHEALLRADSIVKEHPDWWKEKPYRKPKPYQCQNCQARPVFAITDMTKIYEILGYVE